MVRDGGIAEIFSAPIANVATNIENTNASSTVQALGYFAGSAISSLGTRVEE